MWFLLFKDRQATARIYPLQTHTIRSLASSSSSQAEKWQRKESTNAQQCHEREKQKESDAKKRIQSSVYAFPYPFSNASNNVCGSFAAHSVPPSKHSLMPTCVVLLFSGKPYCSLSSLEIVRVI